MPNEITDEIIETGAKAIAKFFRDKDWQQHKAAARAAITFTAPRLRAQGMREAARLYLNKYDSYYSAKAIYSIILERAAELERK